MAIDIVDIPIKNGDFPWQNVSSPEGIFQTPFWRHVGAVMGHRNGIDLGCLQWRPDQRGLHEEWQNEMKR